MSTPLPLDQRSGSRLPASLYALEECLRSAIGSILAHGLRSFLTMLGIIIGVASVICVIALVQGLSQSISNQFQGLGGNTLTLRAYTPFEDQLRGKRNRLRVADLDQLKYRITSIKNITPIVFAGGRSAEVRNGANVASGQFFGTTASYQDVQQNFPKQGRFLTESDDASRRRVVVLGEQMRRDLKLPDNPAGQFIQIGNEWFKVVGSMEPRGEIFGQSQDNYLLMPYQTALTLNGISAQPDLWITFSITDLGQIDAVKDRVTALMRQLHQLKTGQADDFVIEASDTFAKSFKEITTTITLVVAGIVGISLLVGGVGIMNIMLVSVTERTREIGIAKALGAPRHFILMQFLIEAVVLAVLGGLIGIVLGYALSFGVAKFIPNFPNPTVPWWAIVGACGFSGLIGIIFGILPASKAANLAPIDALRYE
ncbi:MAG: ABC transporter permease [Betaproteobacteria bacterium]|nr:ABC transporter permease [Betaproteobacteria bacterium]